MLSYIMSYYLLLFCPIFREYVTILMYHISLYPLFSGHADMLSTQAQILLKNKQKQKDKELKNEKINKKQLLMVGGVKKESDYMRKKALAAAAASLNLNNLNKNNIPGNVNNGNNNNSNNNLNNVNNLNNNSNNTGISNNSNNNNNNNNGDVPHGPGSGSGQGQGSYGSSAGGNVSTLGNLGPPNSITNNLGGGNRFQVNIFFV